MQRDSGWTGRLLKLLDPIYRREQLEDEIQEEIRFHLDQRTEENLRAGLSPARARRSALERFGDRIEYQQACREVHGIRPPRKGDTKMGVLLQDISYGLRTLIRNPGFTLVAVLTLALGIGANTAIFSVIHTVLLAPLPYENPDELQLVWGFNPEIGTETASLPDFVDWRAQNDVFVDLAASFRRSVNLTGDGDPERLIAARVTANHFSLLGATPALGRSFLAEEDQPGGEKVVILSHGLWERRFAARKDLLGEDVLLDSEPHTVVGIARQGFELPSRAELWLPLALDPTQAGRRSDFLLVVGRLSPGVSQAQAQAAMDTIAQGLQKKYPQTNTMWGIQLVSLHEELVADVRPTLLALLGAVTFVLLIACANVANLLLARAVGRDELAVRAALGAGRLRLARQVLTENILLFLLGGFGGIVLGWAGIRLLVALQPGDVPRIDQLALDGTVAAFTLGLALLTGLFFGLAPALHATNKDLFQPLREGGTRATGGRGAFRLRNLLVIGEIALSLVLLIGAGLMIQSLQHLQRVDPGFNPENLLTMRLALPEGQYSEPAQIQTFFDQLEERVAALPGVDSAAAVSSLYIAGGAPYLSFSVEGQPPPPSDRVVDAQIRTVTTDFFQTLEIALQRGESFGELHGPNAQLVAMINETMARRYFADEDPIGQRLAFNGTDEGPSWRRIIGIVGDVKQEGLDAATYSEIYVPFRQSPRPAMTLVARTHGDPLRLAGAIRGEVLALDGNQPIFAVQTMDQALTDSLAEQRFAMFLFSLFAAVALALAAVGIYGVISYSVGQRTREIGVRMAMGARPEDILRMVVSSGLLLTTVGLALGLGAASILTKYLDSLLFEVETTEPTAFVSIAALLAVVAVLACLIPARRAMKIAPVDAVRGE